jgi:hypothetical protein
MGAPPPPELPERIPAAPGVPAAPMPPVPLPDQMSDRFKGVYWSPSTYIRLHLFTMAAIFLVIAATMEWQSERYTSGTLRGLRFVVAWQPPWRWAILFGLAGLLNLAAGFLYPRLAALATAMGALLMAGWMILFALAWLLSNATPLSFLFCLAILVWKIQVATMLDGRRRWTEMPPLDV